MGDPVTTNICFGGALTAVGLTEDLKQGLIDRFRSLPMARSAVLAGRTFADVIVNLCSIAIMIAVGLIAPLRRVAGRYTDAVRAVFARGGIGLSVLSLVALFVSESSGLFGFVEHGYRMAIVSAIVAEAAATVFLVTFLMANGTGLQNIRSDLR